MSQLSRAAHIEALIDELIALYLAQAVDLREYARAAVKSDGNAHLERALRRREVQRADLYRQFERAAFPVSPASAFVDQAETGEPGIPERRGGNLQAHDSETCWLR